MKKNTNNYRRLDKGFTLIELLVVVSIIAILSVVGLTVFTGAQSSARDARRRADVDAIANLLETTRIPGAAYYISLPPTFTTGAVPTDNTTAQYSIRTTTNINGVVPGNATTWGVTSAIPTAPAPAAGESSWTAILAAGLAISAVANAPFQANTTAWTICARLENYAADPIYCKQNAQ